MWQEWLCEGHSHEHNLVARDHNIGTCAGSDLMDALSGSGDKKGCVTLNCSEIILSQQCSIVNIWDGEVNALKRLQNCVCTHFCIVLINCNWAVLEACECDTLKLQTALDNKKYNMFCIINSDLMSCGCLRVKSLFSVV